MLLNDCHVHTGNSGKKPEDFIKLLDEANVQRAILLSYPPDAIRFINPETQLDRLKTVLETCETYPDRLVPFYFIDPLEEDAIDQVERAVESGIRGFKVIPKGYFPRDPIPMKVFERIGQLEKPILFHAGISYGGMSFNSRPADYELLLEVPKLKFILAHVAWPWHDECIALYGKWNWLKSNGRTTAEMFIDSSPGTPKLYREEVLSKVYNIGYKIEDNFLWGTDCTCDYNVEYSQSIVSNDSAILDRVGITAEQKEKYFSKNFLRFIGEAE